MASKQKHANLLSINMKTFDIRVSNNGEHIALNIIPKDDYFIITHREVIIGGPSHEGSDWVLIQRDEIEEWQLTDYDDHAGRDNKLSNSVMLGPTRSLAKSKIN